MLNNREVIGQKKQYCMIHHKMLSCQNNTSMPINEKIKNVCVRLKKYSKILGKHQKIVKNQSYLKSVLSIKKAFLPLFLHKKHLKCLFSQLFFSSFLNNNNIIYNIDIISNTKIKIIN